MTAAELPVLSQLVFDLETAESILEAADKLSLLPLLCASEAACQQQVDEDTVETFAKIAQRLHLSDLHAACDDLLLRKLYRTAADCSDICKW